MARARRRGQKRGPERHSAHSKAFTVAHRFPSSPFCTNGTIASADMLAAAVIRLMLRGFTAKESVLPVPRTTQRFATTLRGRNITHRYTKASETTYEWRASGASHVRGQKRATRHCGTTLDYTARTLSRLAHSQLAHDERKPLQLVGRAPAKAHHAGSRPGCDGKTHLRCQSWLGADAEGRRCVRDATWHACVGARLFTPEGGLSTTSRDLVEAAARRAGPPRVLRRWPCYALRLAGRRPRGVALLAHSLACALQPAPLTLPRAVIMDVVNVEQARIAEEAGAVAGAFCGWSALPAVSRRRPPRRRSTRPRSRTPAARRPPLCVDGDLVPAQGETRAFGPVFADARPVSLVMALERVPADIRKDGGVARMSDPDMIKKIKAAVRSATPLCFHPSVLTRRTWCRSPSP